MLVTALLIGFIGSLHCLGMCSPLVVAVSSLTTPYFKNRVIYNITRIASYSVQGAFISMLGSLFNFPKFQIIFSLSLGTLLIFLGIAGITSFKLPIVSSLMQRFTLLLKNLFSTVLKKRNNLSLAVLGFLNGLLPCGLTYLALSYCVILPTYMSGFFFMLFFGLGTLPIMLGFTSIAQVLVKKFSINFKKVTVGALLVIGAVLVARGIWQHSTNPILSSIIVCQPK